MMKITSLLNRKFRDRDRNQQFRQQLRTRLLRCELMEVRALLAATIINVDTFDDVVDAGENVTSLREAIIQANSTPGDFQKRPRSKINYRITHRSTGRIL